MYVNAATLTINIFAKCVVVHATSFFKKLFHQAPYHIRRRSFFDHITIFFIFVGLSREIVPGRFNQRELIVAGV